jgi:hypothetical protein
VEIANGEQKTKRQTAGVFSGTDLQRRAG